MYRTFHFPFHPGSIRRAEPGMKFVVVGEPGKLDIEDRPATLPPDNHLLHTVVEDLFRDTAQIIEGMDVAVHEGLKSPLFYELDIHGTGISENHDKGKDRMSRPVGFHDLEVSPVNLCLEGWFRFEPDISDPRLLALYLPHGVPYRCQSSRISHTGKLLEYPGSLVVVLFEIGIDHRPVGIQNALLPFRLVIHGKRTPFQMAFHCLPVKTGNLRNSSDAQSIPIHCFNVHKYLPCNHWQPSFTESVTIFFTPRVVHFSLLFLVPFSPLYLVPYYLVI